jgi:predicted TIM-barrel fold metal-dependent hydrolase
MKKYKIIDSHCHIYPDKIADKASNATADFYELPPSLDGKISTLLEHGKRAGIDHFIVQSVATTPKQVGSINEFIAKEVANSDGLMTGLGTLHPDSADMKADVKHLLELGLRGVKLHPDIQAFKIDDYRCLKIYELCEKHKLPILMHTGDYRYDYSNPNRLVPILQIYTDLVVVGAHFGGWSIWEEASNKLSNFKNFYVDCSSSFPYLEMETAKKIIDRYTPDRVLFGTDYPMWSPKNELETFLNLNLSEDDNKKILSENARKIYKF